MEAHQRRTRTPAHKRTKTPLQWLTTQEISSTVVNCIFIAQGETVEPNLNHQITRRTVTDFYQSTSDDQLEQSDNYMDLIQITA